MRRVSQITAITIACALALSGVAVLASGAASAQTAVRHAAATAYRPSVSFRGVRGAATRITSRMQAASVQRRAGPVTGVAPEGLLFPDSTT